MTTDNTNNNGGWGDWPEDEPKEEPSQEPTPSKEAPARPPLPPPTEELPLPQPTDEPPEVPAESEKLQEGGKREEREPLPPPEEGNDDVTQSENGEKKTSFGGGWGGKHSNGSADIVFLIDVTGSMSPCIQALKNSIKRFLSELANGTGDIKPVEDWRARIVGYRDYPADKDSSYGWLNEFDFTRDTTLLETQLDSLKARGGGDDPESLLDAVSVVLDAGVLPDDYQKEVNDKRWRSNIQAAHILVIFTDAPFHETMSVPGHEGETYDDLNRRLIDFRTHGFLFIPGSEQYETSFAETSNMILQDCGAGADGLGEVMSNPVKLRDILIRLQRGISRSSQAW